MTDHKTIVKQVNSTLEDIGYYKTLIDFEMLLNSKIKKDCETETLEKLYDYSIKISDDLKKFYEIIKHVLNNG